MHHDLQIRICTASDIVQIERQVPSSGPDSIHAIRYTKQSQGHSTYLIAWLDEKPVGHLDLLWEGPEVATAKDILGSCPELNAIVVIPQYRSQGIGTRLIAKAEEMARERGLSAVCLAVSIENSRARTLYERLGYVDWGSGVIEASWSIQDSAGQVTRHSEQVIYLRKHLHC